MSWSTKCSGWILAGALCALWVAPVPWAAQPAAPLPTTGGDGLALSIVFDTSGSMKDPVLDTRGKPKPKYRTATQALRTIVQRLERYAAGTSEPKHQIEAGLIIFQVNHAATALKFGPFDPAAFRRWADSFAAPEGATPLGEAVAQATQTVLASKLSRKHVLVITDGENTAGADPAGVLPRLQKQAARAGALVGFHFVAFDVSAKVFEPVKRLGATVLSAADETQLSTQLEFILEHKILLEDEEPPAKTNATPTPK